MYGLLCLGIVPLDQDLGTGFTGDTEEDPGPQPVSMEWWAEFVKPEDEEKIELSGKVVLLFEILRMSEEIGDKV